MKSLMPSLAVLAKIGSIVVHAEEGASDDGHVFDTIAMRVLIEDREVQLWLKAMRKASLLPVRRGSRAEGGRDG